MAKQYTVELSPLPLIAALGLPASYARLDPPVARDTLALADVCLASGQNPAFWETARFLGSGGEPSQCNGRPAVHRNPPSPFVCR